MNRRRTPSARSLLRRVGSVGCAALLGAIGLPAAAAEEPGSFVDLVTNTAARIAPPALSEHPLADYAQAANTFAGSQIARIEGVHGLPALPRALASGRTLGHDVSGHQGEVTWRRVADGGARFSYVKASEGTGYTNPFFRGQYDGAHAVGLVRGAYHFARPDVSDGATQARYFIAHGGGWRSGGSTLPGALDIEYNPYGDACYGRSPAAMTAWITDFTRTYLAEVGRSAVIYTSTTWWKRCTGNTARFGDTNPLWLARYAPSIGELPAGWDKQSIWQFSNSGSLPGDQNYYNGPFARVEALARGN